ncbi:serine/threonine-protein kinase 4-like [Anoplophora glabripennis]|uniref:serine/threonine-protein kinase 4-like n=1 Tax=Anoplophora glabripennis TaxID=217634 RepID=UPI000C75EC1A|nr:serine/threonine-protein kinase 4-like [Anoplophora glabripennis]
MPSKNKKNFSRKGNKNYKRWRSNANNVAVDIKEETMLVEAQQNNKQTNKKLKKRPLKKNCLSVIEQTANRLKEDDGARLLNILEKLFAVVGAEPKKRVVGLELISALLSNVDEYDKEEIGSLKVKLNSVFLPKELKRLIVDPKDLREVYNVYSLILFGVLQGRTYLNKDGCKIDVQIREGHGRGDDANIVQEAKLLSQLCHQNIIKILGFVKEGPKFATEYMKLGELSSALQKYDFTSKKLLGLLKGVTSAMVYISERQYVLRNLSSENILLDSGGNCKIGNLRYCQYVRDTNGIYTDEDDDLISDLSAPEVKQENRFSAKSDTWDMALLACEVFNVNPQKSPFASILSGLMILAYMKAFISDDM